MGRVLRRLRYWLGQDDHEAALAEEIEFHRAMKQHDLEAGGLAPEDARFASRREMGNVARAREESRAMWIWPWLESVGQDVRIAVRALVRQPGFTLLSVIVLGVAIGLNTTLFTVFAGLALRPMTGLANADRVVTVSVINREGGFLSGMSYPQFRHLADQSRTLAGLSATRTTSVSLESGGIVRSTITFAVSGNYFDMLGVRMAHGRGFRPDEDRAGDPRQVVVLGHGLWRTRFGSDARLVGKTVRMNDASYTVVGIAPPEFTGRDGAAMRLWVPLASLPVLRPHDPEERGDLLIRADVCCVNVIGRLADGVSRGRAQADLQVLSNAFLVSVSQPSRPIVLGGTQFLGPRETNTAVAVIGGLFVALVLVLLLACANVGNLVLARAAARTGEIGVRLSLGAGRPRLVRQLLTEGLVLALLASAAGIAVATWLPGFVLNTVAGQPAPFAIETDMSVVAYAILLAGLACLSFALAPALHVTRLGTMASLRQATTTRSSVRMRSVLLGIQVAVTVILLTSAGLLLRGVERARQIDPGFRTDGLMLATVELPEGTYDIPRATAFQADLESSLREGGLESFGFTTTEPFAGFTRFAPVRLPGHGEEQTQGIEFIAVSSEYFQTLGVPMTAGRGFTATDRERPVAIVNESAARRFWSGASAVGQSLVIGEDRTLKIVGVVKDAHIDDFDEVTPLLFLPLARAQADDFPRLVFRAQEAAATAVVASAVTRMESRTRLEIVPLTARLEDELTELVLAPLAASVLGLFGLGLATIGMFGVFGFVVRQRTREIGIRIALGARAAEIIRLVLMGTSRPVVAGLVVGLLGALGASQVLRSELYGVSPLDPLTYAGVALLLSVAAMAASYLPARRAVRLDPTQALRE